ncbi:hypothetical protein SAMN06265364_12232 [Prevotella jejuni]|uniref:Uncharacterized protein n=1 Tax=Prevotella jejuni TaxID=1177574 RepID=A0AA94LKU8_9BACT|nr:hypothetical protein SAMN06265364_12232 [Prevotella jejuni]
MLFLPQEGRLQHARRACSRTKKGLFLYHLRTLFERIGEWFVKHLYNSCYHVLCLFLRFQYFCWGSLESFLQRAIRGFTYK